MAPTAPILTTNDVAAKLATDPKTLRKFFRSDKCTVVPVGQGKRYQLTAADVKGMTKAFKAWHTVKAIKVDEAPAPTNGKAPKKPRKVAKPAPVEELDDDDLELDDIEPTNAELDDLDMEDDDDE